MNERNIGFKLSSLRMPTDEFLLLKFLELTRKQRLVSSMNSDTISVCKEIAASHFQSLKQTNL